MFQRFLDAANYWFGCSDTSSAGSYDPACECFMVAIGDVVDGASSAGAGGGEPLGTKGQVRPGTRGRARPPPHQREVPTSTRN
jgi:hypothetical protein